MIVGNAIKELQGKASQKAAEELRKHHKFALETEEGTFEVDEEYVEITSSGREGFAEGTFNGGQVFIRTELTPELIQEGLVRDIIRRIQSMRKDSNLEYTQNIEVYYKGDKQTKEAIEQWKDFIQNETLATVIKSGTSTKGTKADWDIDGVKITLTIVPL